MKETSEPSLSRGSQEAKIWAHERAEAFGNAVQFWRKRLGLTAVDLSNRTKEVGYPITRATIAKIESNSRNSKVDLAEITALSAALQVAPVDLIFPGQPAAKYRVTPRSPMVAQGCSDWFYGDENYMESTAFRLGGPHAPLTDNSVELRRAINDFESYSETIRNLPELRNDKVVGPSVEPIHVEGATQYKRLLASRKDAVERLGGKVNLPFWYSRIQEPESNSDGER